MVAAAVGLPYGGHLGGLPKERAEGSHEPDKSGTSYFTARERQELMALLRPPTVRVQSLHGQSNLLRKDPWQAGGEESCLELGQCVSTKEEELTEAAIAESCSRLDQSNGTELVPSRLPTALTSILSQRKRLEDFVYKSDGRVSLRASENSAFCTLGEYQQQQLSSAVCADSVLVTSRSLEHHNPLPLIVDQAKPHRSFNPATSLKDESKIKSMALVSHSGGCADGDIIRRWQRAGRRKSQWTESEDKSVCDLVAMHGLGKWKLLARQLGSKSPKQIHARWRDYLRPGIRNDEPWTIEELRRLASLHQQLGNHWTDLAAMLPGRSANAIKNRINAARRRRRMSNEIERQIWAYLKEEGS